MSMSTEKTPTDQTPDDKQPINVTIGEAR